MAVEELSILARPPGTPKPKGSLEALGKKAGSEVSPGIRRMDARLVERLELSVDHFRKGRQVSGSAGAWSKPGEVSSRVLIVSGYRPRSAGSYHQVARALDFRIDGVKNEALVAFCKTLPDTGCGYYPNSLFVHMDVREPGAGHVAWIDISRPGEPPRYVSQWPLPAGATASSSASPPPLPEPRERPDVEQQSPPGRSRPHPFHTYVF